SHAKMKLITVFNNPSVLELGRAVKRRPGGHRPLGDGAAESSWQIGALACAAADAAARAEEELDTAAIADEHIVVAIAVEVAGTGGVPRVHALSRRRQRHGATGGGEDRNRVGRRDD